MYCDTLMKSGPLSLRESGDLALAKLLRCKTVMRLGMFLKHTEDYLY